MRKKITKKLLSTFLILVAVLGLGALLLSQFVTNYYILIGVCVIQLIIFTLLLVHFQRKYIKPIEKASRTMDRLLEGRFHARVHHEMTGTIGELSTKINLLARNLSELSISEKLQSEQLTTIIENSESALVLIDDKGYIHVVNRKFTSLSGKTAEEYIGYLYYDSIVNEEIHEVVQEAFLYEKRVKKLLRYKENNEKIYLEIIGAPFFNEKNLLKGIVIVIYDISELKHLEMMRKDFVANVSHELRTPITSIQGFAETLLDGAADDLETRDHFLKIMFNESKRIHLLIDDLLILSKLEQEDFQLNVVEFDIASLVEDLMIVVHQQAKQKEISVTMTVEPGLQLQADNDKIRQVLLNLLMNAISYTPEEGDVSLVVYQDPDNIVFEVKDTGIGIDNSLLPRLFERFYRIDKDRSRDTGGTGLGLAIVKHIIEVHKGSIDVESELGEGSKFIVMIPKIVKK